MNHFSFLLQGQWYTELCETHHIGHCRFSQITAMPLFTSVAFTALIIAPYSTYTVLLKSKKLNKTQSLRKFTKKV